MFPINHFLAKQFIYLTLLISPHKSVLLVFGSCLVLFPELSNLSISRNAYNIADGAVPAPYKKWLFLPFSVVWYCLPCSILYWPFHTMSCCQFVSFSVRYLTWISFIIIASQSSPSCYCFSDALLACIFSKLSLVIFFPWFYLL